ncbi:MAG: hypothetical protein IKU60_05600 [Clostridia bacterium]|nr:hypothetical protein [Clostridia bacterium]
MIFVWYVLAALVLVGFSIKCADYVDMLDKKTNMSGAFIGGVILAAVTSLPEMITSISAVALGNPGLIIGNVLGSDVFNLCIFGSLTLIAVSAFRKSTVGTSHFKVLICTVLAYLTTGFVLFSGLDTTFPGVSINVASVIIVILYAISCKFMATDDSESDNEDDNDLTVKQVVVRFVLCALGLVVASIVITKITDMIDSQYNLGASLAGALFLGVATSIPELTSSIALVRKGNFNAMTGNVVGSNMFNYIIFSVADILAFKSNVYEVSADSKLLIIFGLVSAVAAMISLAVKKRTSTEESLKKNSVAVNGTLMLLGLVICASYVAFIVCSMANG